MLPIPRGDKINFTGIHPARQNKSLFFNSFSGRITIRFDPISTPNRLQRVGRYVLKKTAAVLVISALISALPFGAAHAGVFSLLGSIFKPRIASDDAGQEMQSILARSLHTMPLLSAPVSAETQKTAQGGAALAIVDNSALLAVTGPLGSSTDASDVIKTGRITLYTVREGDNISVLAQMFGVTVNTILWANDISSRDLIQPGDVLVILPVSGIKHTVAEGDTLSTITKKYKGDLGEIMAFNGLPADAPLSIGSEVIIPDGEMFLAPASPASSSGTRIAVNSGSLKDAGGYYTRPVNGVRSQGLHGYNGVDLAAGCGEVIYAAAAGTVIVSKGYGWNGGYGNYIVITHANGTQTLYAHNTANLVSSGEYVGQGEVIGTVGTTGRSTGCHVHFEVRGSKNPF